MPSLWLSDRATVLPRRSDLFLLLPSLLFSFPAVTCQAILLDGPLAIDGFCFY
jgi:hypothetical protein